MLFPFMEMSLKSCTPSYRHVVGKDVKLIAEWAISCAQWKWHKLEQEFGEKYVAIGSTEVIKQHLWHFTGVFEETEDCDKHLDELDGWQLLDTLHVFYTQCYTTLTYTHRHIHKHTLHQLQLNSSIKKPIFIFNPRLNWHCTARTTYIGDGFLRIKWTNQQCQSTEGRCSRIRLQSFQVHTTVLQ